ncbi:hypothetical protein COR50_04650 [Chitinophaga caeni]|uniref:Gliding motility lipoprotein GldH n=1 Tax=Chitinophaga caeni TaxID=2029983 RepID=A0A291QRI4_9BACT|nr:gliding motility lipoprotein GldH [Chitinophaga caeni]ATL46521.1 hypothetical protein COR50_04650 [Chitinophaga caeni]
MKYCLAVATLVLLFLSACQPMQMDVYEKNIEIPQHDWTYDFKPSFELDLQAADTAFYYNIYVNIRHEDAYPFSNLWMTIMTTYPDSTAQEPVRVQLPLADINGKWLGSGIDDIYEHQVLIQEKAIFNQPGKYLFTFAQKMRQNPLPHVMNVGLRVEKAAHR